MDNNYFRIEWIIDLLKEQEPEEIDLIKQLEQSTERGWIRQPMIYFGSDIETEEQFDRNIVLEHETKGTIVLDILKNGKIRSIEFVNQIRE